MFLFGIFIGWLLFAPSSKKKSKSFARTDGTTGCTGITGYFGPIGE